MPLLAALFCGMILSQGQQLSGCTHESENCSSVLKENNKNGDDSGLAQVMQVYSNFSDIICNGVNKATSADIKELTTPPPLLTLRT